MNNSTVNFTTPEASTNSTNQSIGLLDNLDICGYSITFLFGLPTNSYVIWLIITGKGSGVASEFFNLSLSVCEIGISLNGLVFALSNYFFSLSMLKAFLLGLTFTAHPLFQCLICVERYLAVVHPVTFLKFKPLRYRVICCTVAWIMNLGSCFVSMFTFALENFEYILFLTVLFLLFLFIQLFCLVAVLRALKQSGPGERGSEKEGENHMKRRAFNLILITTVNVAIIHVLYAFIALNTILIQQYIREDWFVPLICYVLPGFVQPVLYLYRAGKLPCLLNYITFI